MEELKIWCARDVGNSCSLASLQGYPDDWKLYDGVPLESEFPSDVFFPMDPNYPRRSRLTDCIKNLNKTVVVSGRVRDFLAARDLPGVEYLPVGIRNHKGVMAKGGPFYIVHPNSSVDCLDLEACEPRYSSIVKTEVATLKRLVIENSKLDPALQLFRVRHVSGQVFVRNELAEALNAEGFLGFHWLRLEYYEG